MTNLETAEALEPKKFKVRINLSATQYDALYAFSRRTGIPMGKVLRDSAMRVIDAAGATT